MCRIRFTFDFYYLTGFIKEYLKGNFIYNVATFLVGTAFARAIPFHTISLILTSLYTPNDFGELTLFTLFTAMFVVVASHRYEIAIDPLAQRYQNFPRYNAPHTLIDSITNNGINFL